MIAGLFCIQKICICRLYAARRMIHTPWKQKNSAQLLKNVTGGFAKNR
jgi:hypothetical protein